MILGEVVRVFHKLWQRVSS